MTNDRNSYLGNLLGITAALTFLITPSLSHADESALLKLRGVSHIHTTYSHDSNATLRNVLEQMEKEALDFAVVTDHNSIVGEGMYQKVEQENGSRLIFANEISTPDGHLIALGVSVEPPENASSQQLIDWIHENKGYAILAHPLSVKGPWQNWDIKNWDGFEVYNFAHELYEKDIIGFGIDLHSGEEDTVLKTVQTLSPASEKLWNALLKRRHVAALSGSNAHLKRDMKYFRVAMRSSVIYVLVPDRLKKSVVEALGKGKSYIVFETYGSGENFSFTAVHKNSLFHIGDTLDGYLETVLHVKLPEIATIKIIHNGDIVKETIADELNFAPVKEGAYRVEIYRDQALWIFTNPIYIETQANE